MVRIPNFTKVFGHDDDAGNLNNMADFDQVERIADLKAAAEEKLEQLDPDSKQAREIRNALTNLEGAHFSADQSSECNERGGIRGGRI